MTPKYGHYQGLLWFSAGVLVTTVVVNYWLLLGLFIGVGLLATCWGGPKPHTYQPHNIIQVAPAPSKTSY